MTKPLALAAALALTLGSTAAHADGFTFGGLFAGPSPAAQGPVRQAAHNRYAPFDGVETVETGRVYSSGYYASKARAEGIHSRYDN